MAGGTSGGYSKMIEPLPIALTQLVLWYDSVRIQSWPALLAGVDPEAVFASPTDVGRSHATERMTDNRHAAAEKITRNLPGLEHKAKKWILRGVGLIEAGQGGYRLSTEGCDIARTYREEPYGKGWIRVLARLLAMREPRTRAVIGLLSEQDAVLRFAGSGWFKGSQSDAVIVRPGQQDLAPFASRAGSVANLRPILESRAWWALGAWRDTTGMSEEQGCRFVGQLKGAFSLHDIGLALRASMEVFLQLGVFVQSGGETWLDHTRAAAELGRSVATDFGWEPNTVPAFSVTQFIAEYIQRHTSDTGFLVAADLRRALAAQGIENPDREIARLDAEGKLSILAHEHGQGRHGRGLYDDPGKQLIKIKVQGV